MVPDNSQSQDVDLDRTDRLPILEGARFDDDVADDAVHLDYSPVAKSVKSEFRRPSPVDLPTLAESVRSVEERIARRNAELAGARAAADLAQARMEEALRESEQHLRESRTLRDTLAARDATIAHVQHSLAERDAQLSALQREHAQIVPSLEERSTAAVQLEADLRTAQARFESVTTDLNGTREAVATLTEKFKRADAELQTTRRDLNGVKAQAAAHLERLRTREFRRALDESRALEVDHGPLLSERDGLRRRVTDLGAQLATRDEALAKLQSSSADAQRGKDMLLAAEQSRADLALEVLRQRAEAQEREGQMEVLLAHLQEARRLIGQRNVEVKQPTGESTARPRAMEQLTEENRSLRAALDRTRGALEEREFILRRLERGESNDASAAGRTQPEGAVAAAPLDCSVDLIRIDGSHNEAHAMSRRTRIGRAPGCELHVDSSSVSRHHALLLTNSRDVIIEDLHSTNGVLVNGRKVTRQLLTDGDILTIGEAQFRLSVKPGPREREAAEPGAG